MIEIAPVVPKGTIYQDEREKTSLETRNGVIQARFVLYTAAQWMERSPVVPELLLELQRIAVNQIYRCAGRFRDGPVTIKNNSGAVLYQPPDHDLVPALAQEMCEYINQNWTTMTPVHLAAYAMWRSNWIHPFFGGNGRTARAFSYLVLCIGLQFAPPATQKNIPQLIEENREPYNVALREADRAWAAGRLDRKR